MGNFYVILIRTEKTPVLSKIGYQSAIQRHSVGKVIIFSWTINLIPGIPLLFDETISDASLHGCNGC